jgi:fatty-acyl-CoA synthase
MSFEYLNDAEKTAASRHHTGWMTVGDIGYLDDDGYLYLTDRRHHMIISGGVNIYPQEAENMLVTHPKVMDAAVFGIPDDEMGQSVKGVIQLVDPADAGEELAEELLVWLRDRLAHRAPDHLLRAAAAAHRYRQAVQAGTHHKYSAPTPAG